MKKNDFDDKTPNYEKNAKKKILWTRFSEKLNENFFYLTKTIPKKKFYELKVSTKMRKFLKRKNSLGEQKKFHS